MKSELHQGLEVVNRKHIHVSKTQINMICSICVASGFLKNSVNCDEATWKRNKVQQVVPEGKRDGTELFPPRCRSTDQITHEG